MYLHLVPKLFHRMANKCSLKSMQMLGSRQNSAQGGRGQPQQPQQGRQFSGNSPSPGNTTPSGSFSDDDDSIPF